MVLVVKEWFGIDGEVVGDECKFVMMRTEYGFVIDITGFRIQHTYVTNMVKMTIGI